jgi:hypothetical protein
MQKKNVKMEVINPNTAVIVIGIRSPVERCLLDYAPLNIFLHKNN